MTPQFGICNLDIKTDDIIVKLRNAMRLLKVSLITDGLLSNVDDGLNCLPRD